MFISQRLLVYMSLSVRQPIVKILHDRCTPCIWPWVSYTSTWVKWFYTSYVINLIENIRASNINIWWYVPRGNSWLLNSLDINWLIMCGSLHRVAVERRQRSALRRRSEQDASCPLHPAGGGYARPGSALGAYADASYEELLLYPR